MEHRIKHDEKFFVDLKEHGRPLFIEDVILFYDKPLLFTCFNALKSRFIVNCINESDSDIEWLIAKISNKRLIKAYKKKILLHEIFKNTESQKVLLVKQLQGVCTDSVVTIHELPCSSLTIDQLPSPNSYIESETEPNYIAYLEREIEESEELKNVQRERHNS